MFTFSRAAVASARPLAASAAAVAARKAQQAPQHQNRRLSHSHTRRATETNDHKTTAASTATTAALSAAQVAAIRASLPKMIADSATETVDQNLRAFLLKQAHVQHSEAAVHPSSASQVNPATVWEIACFIRATHNVMNPLEVDGRAHYSISPAGEEMGIPLALALRPTDPLFLHYRGAGSRWARAFQLRGTNAFEEEALATAREYVCAATAPTSGGRHQINANPADDVLPVSPAIGTHVIQALGLSTSLHLPRLAAFEGFTGRFLNDSIAVATLGDGSINHPSVLSAINMAKVFRNEGKPIPMVLAVTDNEIAISKPTEASVTAQQLRETGLAYYFSEGRDPFDVHGVMSAAVDHARSQRELTVMHLLTKRPFGHSANPRNENWSPEKLAQVHADDPMKFLALAALRSGLTAADLIHIYDSAHDTMKTATAQALSEAKLATADDVMAPLGIRHPQSKTELPVKSPDKKVPLNRALSRLYAAALEAPNVLFYGQDVVPGHYGVGMQPGRSAKAFDFPIDEIALTGVANGMIWNGLVPIVELSYLEYRREGTLSGLIENLLLKFQSAQQQAPKGFVLRTPGFGGVKGGPTHNENWIPEIGIAGLPIFCPSNAYAASLVVPEALALAQEGTTSLVIEPTKQYSNRDLFEDGDKKWLFPTADAATSYKHGDIIGYTIKDQDVQIKHNDAIVDPEKLPDDAIIVATYANGVHMSLNAVKELQDKGITRPIVVIEYPSLKASEQLLQCLSGNHPVLIVDEARPEGSPGQVIQSHLAESGKLSSRVGSKSSYIPSGPSGSKVYVSVPDITAALERIFGDDTL